MLFDDLACSQSEFQSVGISTEKARSAKHTDDTSMKGTDYNFPIGHQYL